MTETNRQKLLARIRALFSKTVANGATEAEELAATKKARELIEQYQIDLGAEELKREGFTMKNIELEHANFTFARRIMLGIDRFCEVKSWYETWGVKPVVTVFGLASDAEFAVYLIKHLTMFAVSGADLHVAAERKIRATDTRARRFAAR